MGKGRGGQRREEEMEVGEGERAGKKEQPCQGRDQPRGW